MRLLYVDESSDSEVYVVGGVYLPDNKYRKFDSDFEKFLSNLDYYPYPAEVHADHIWNGRNDFNQVKSMNKRAEISEKIAKFLGTSKLTRFITSTEHIDGRNKTDIYINLLNKIVKKATAYTSKGGKTNKQLLLVFDQRQDISQEIHAQLLERRAEITKEYSSSCSFIDAGYEGISKHSRLLQTADFISYWTRLIEASPKNPSLLKAAADDRKIELAQRVKIYWENKLIRV